MLMINILILIPLKNMYLIKSDSQFLFKKLSELFLQKGFNYQNNYNYGEICFSLKQEKIIIEFKKIRKTLKLPEKFDNVFIETQNLLQDNELILNNLSYNPIKETLAYQGYKIKLRNTHNLIIKEAFINKTKGIDKLSLYRSIWPSDVDFQVNKLDTHLTNLKNLLRKELDYNFHFKSNRGIITFLIN